MTTVPQPEALRTAIEPVLAEFSLILEDMSVRARSGQTELRLVVDLPDDALGAPDLDTVADASEAISSLLDEREDLLGEGPTVLEVTTPGLERPLSDERRLHRARGRLVELPEQSPHAGLRARILDVAGGQVLLRSEPGRDDRGRPLKAPAGTPSHPVLSVDEAAGARIVVEFDPPTDLQDFLDRALADAPALPATAPKES